MKRSRLPLSFAVILLASSCATGPAAPPPATAAQAPAAAQPVPHAAHPPAAAQPPAAEPAPRLAFTHDDVPAAMKRAAAENKAVVVDVWAPWCHTCLSMKAYVLSDPSLAPLANRAVFVAIDSDRDDNAAFLARHAVTAWPTFFVLDPKDDRVTGYLPGSASAREFRSFVEEGVAAMDASRAPAGAKDDPARLLGEAHAAFANRDLARAAASYEKALARGGAWPRRSEALLGWIRALYAAKDWAGCARVGREHVEEAAGSSAPADFAFYTLMCAGKLPAGNDQTKTRSLALGRLEAMAKSPPPESSADDRADVLSILAEARADAGDAAGARAANEARAAIMERAAAEAPTPQIAATYDYGRAGAYVALGRGDDAVKLLEAREREQPDSYEPPARLADVLLQLGRFAEGKAAVDRAIQRSYGPRKLRYLGTRATLLGKLGDHAGEIAALREMVAGYEALPPGHASPERLADAKKRLADAQATR